jgi:glyoxylase-like metal-dependent hydrolase (beta-lactamase superfamily II)
MIQVFPLSEGEFTVGHDKEFIPFTPGSNLADRSTGSLHVEVQPFLVKTENDLIVLDTGLGQRTAAGTLQLTENIRNAGFAPEEVTLVLHSHLHKDHAGGATFTDEHGRPGPTFPNARYALYRREVDFALAKGSPAFSVARTEEMLLHCDIQWLDGDSGYVTDHVQFFHTGGHSPYHIVFLIENEGGTVFYGGDEAPQLKQMKFKYIAKYDYDGRKASEIRARYAETGAREGWLFLFYHDVKCPTARL